MYLRQHLSLIFGLLVTSLGLMAFYGIENPGLANLLWLTAVLPVLILALWDIFKSLRRGNVGVDLIAVLAMAAALILSEHLAAAVIALMYAGGQTLEQYAANRAKRELTALLNRAPNQVDRYAQDGLETVPIDEIKPGDRLLIKTGSVLPVDGYVADSTATLDESSLTGESLPVTRSKGQAVSSGCLNVGQPFDLITVHDAASSAYAGVIKLVEEAQTSKAPFTRLADRYALWLIPFTLLIAGIAWWISGDPIRALAVLVVATPCPLILAAPIAIVAGISSAARNGLLIKNGAALEALAKTQRLIIDKTGTLTTGNPQLMAIETDGKFSMEELLQLAASIEQASFHVVSNSIVQSAQKRNLPLSIPQEVNEIAGSGLQGIINHQQIMIGQPQWVLSHTQHADWIMPILASAQNEGRMVVLIAIEHQIRGALLLQDEIRADTPRALRSLRNTGIQSIVMASGDQQDIADTLGNALGLNKVYGNLKPENKVDIVRQERAHGITLMVGDGVNDAPALAIADIGVAMGAGGAGASSEAADALLLVDRLDALADGLRIARHSQNIAKQSVIVGMGLSGIAMLFAAAGYLTPLAGALLQEGIDVLVILNALRALHTPKGHPSIIDADQQQNLQQAHIDLQPTLERIRQAADNLASNQPINPQQLNELAQHLEQKLIPHEQADERQLHPQLAHKMVGNDPMAMLSSTHREILELCKQYLFQWELHKKNPTEQQRQAMIRILYSLSAILQLHFAQENELYALLAISRQA